MQGLILSFHFSDKIYKTSLELLSLFKG